MTVGRGVCRGCSPLIIVGTGDAARPEVCRHDSLFCLHFPYPYRCPFRKYTLPGKRNQRLRRNRETREIDGKYFRWSIRIRTFNG